MKVVYPVIFAELKDEEVETICNENQDPNDRFYFLCQLLCRMYKWDVCQEHTYYV